eukprot:1336589-Rhodomonas_salina.1
MKTAQDAEAKLLGRGPAALADRTNLNGSDAQRWAAKTPTGSLARAVAPGKENLPALLQEARMEFQGARPCTSPRALLASAALTLDPEPLHADAAGHALCTPCAGAVSLDADRRTSLDRRVREVIDMCENQTPMPWEKEREREGQARACGIEARSLVSP